MLNDTENKSEEIEFKEDSTNIENDLKEVAEDIKSHKPVTESKDIVSEEDKLQKELTGIQDKYLRLYSEFENYKRRTTKERIDLFRSANQEVLEAMLPVLDDFERALSSMQLTSENKSIKEGVELIYNKFKSSLIQKGIKEMEVLGKDFDPDFHEAITQSPAPTEDLKGKIIEVLEKGYFLNDKVIRFAKVIIGS